MKFVDRERNRTLSGTEPDIVGNGIGHCREWNRTLSGTGIGHCRERNRTLTGAEPDVVGHRPGHCREQTRVNPGTIYTYVLGQVPFWLPIDHKNGTWANCPLGCPRIVKRAVVWSVNEILDPAPCILHPQVQTKRGSMATDSTSAALGKQTSESAESAPFDRTGSGD